MFAALAVAAQVGCGKVDPPPFRLNMTNVIAKQIAPENQLAIANLLDAMFGTPDEPFVMADDGGHAPPTPPVVVGRPARPGWAILCPSS